MRYSVNNGKYIYLEFSNLLFFIFSLNFFINYSPSSKQQGSFFSLLGIVILALFIKQFTRVISRLLPEQKSTITQYLDGSIMTIPAIATETAMRALKEATKQTFIATYGKLEGLSFGKSLTHSDIVAFDKELNNIQQEVMEIQHFVSDIQADYAASTASYTSILHVLDHLGRMNHLVVQNLNEVKLTNPEERIYPIVFQLGELIMECKAGLDRDRIESIVPKLAEFSRKLAQFRKSERAEVYGVTAHGEVDTAGAFQYVELILLVDGLSYHIWRIMHHLLEGD